MAATEMTEMVLDNLGNTAIYVIRQDNFRILYYNSRVREVSPGITAGAVCHEVWSGSCDNCPLKGIEGKRTNTTVNYDDPFGEIVDLCATRIEWGTDRIPSYLISVTPHVSSREELRRSEESRIRERIVNSTLDAAMEQIFEEIIYFNVPRSEIIFRKGSGFLRELEESRDLTISRMIDGLYPADADEFMETMSKEAIERAFATGCNSISKENRRLGRDGRYHWISTRIMRMEPTGGGEETALALVSNIDTRKQLEIEKNELISSILTLFRELYVLNMETGKFLIYKINRSASQLVENEDYREFSRKYGETLVHPSDRAIFYDAFGLERLRERVKNGEKKVAMEIRRRDEEGNYRHSELLATLLEVGEDMAPKMVLTYRDVDDLKREEERKKRELQTALRMAEQANAAKTDFLSRMSHDIRTPMNAILGMAAIAGENLERPEKLKDCLGKIDVSAQFLLSLINDVLDMSKIESGKMVLSERETDFYELLDGVKVICQNQSTDKKQIFTADIGPGVRQFYICDSLRLNQIIINLTSNAFKYTPEGGEIRLSVDALGIKDGIQELHIGISDNGMGMSEEFMKKMYEPFEQEETGGGRVFEGTGLGLAITCNLVQLMGGTLDAVSEPGKGTDFVVKLPLRLSDGQETAKESGKPSGKESAAGYQDRHFARERVLLVEDNAINREIAQTLLEARGLVVDTAENGRDAVERFGDSRPGDYQAILMDIRMPVMDGLEATRRIRAMNREDARRIPIVAMTANAFLDEQEEAFSSGIDDYLTKPVDVAQMCGCLGRLFAKSKKIGFSVDKSGKVL